MIAGRTAVAGFLALAAAAVGVDAACEHCNAHSLFVTPEAQTAVRESLEDYFWYELLNYTCGLDAVESLGWSEQLWDAYADRCSNVPCSEAMCWDDLTPREAGAAEDLCFEEATWDGQSASMDCTYDEDADPCRDWVFSATEWSYVDWADVVNNTCVLGGLTALGWNEAMWDCQNDADTCCPVPPSDDTCWAGLNDNERCWATKLGFDEADWNSPNGAKPFRGQGQGQARDRLLRGSSHQSIRGLSTRRRAMKCKNGQGCTGIGGQGNCCDGMECRDTGLFTNNPSGKSVCVPSHSNAFQYFNCFSPDTKVDILGKGVLPISKLEVGDEVLTEHGYSQVYGFGRRDHKEPVTYRKISLESGDNIELSPEHLLFVGKTMDAYTADDVEVGQELMLMPSKKLSKITSIEEVVKNGSYHPYTNDGTIIANGVLASVYDAEPFHVNVQLFGTDIVDGHDFKHIAYTPLRLMCKLAPESFCGPQNHFEEDGSHHMVEVVTVMEQLLVPRAVESDEYNFLQLSPFLPFNVAIFAWLLFLRFLENNWLLANALGAWAVVYFTTKVVKKGAVVSSERK